MEKIVTMKFDISTITTITTMLYELFVICFFMKLHARKNPIFKWHMLHLICVLFSHFSLWRFLSNKRRELVWVSVSLFGWIKQFFPCHMVERVNYYLLFTSVSEQVWQWKDVGGAKITVWSKVHLGPSPNWKNKKLSQLWVISLNLPGRGHMLPQYGE